jgi:hypothetical protein
VSHGSKRTLLSCHTTAAVPDAAQESCLWLHLPLSVRKLLRQLSRSYSSLYYSRPVTSTKSATLTLGSCLQPTTNCANLPCSPLSLAQITLQQERYRWQRGSSTGSSELYMTAALSPFAAAGCLWQKPQLASRASSERCDYGGITWRPGPRR